MYDTVEDLNITIIKMEDRQKIYEIFSNNSEVINDSSHEDYKKYYTDESIKLIEKYDNELLKKYNYTFI